MTRLLKANRRYEVIVGEMTGLLKAGPVLEVVPIDDLIAASEFPPYFAGKARRVDICFPSVIIYNDSVRDPTEEHQTDSLDTISFFLSHRWNSRLQVSWPFSFLAIRRLFFQ